MDKLLVPVYLNQKLVFDLLAMLQGGISTVTAITRTSSESNQEQEKISTGFGLSEAFSTLLKIDLSGVKSDTNTSDNKNSATEERVHTPASMFYQLRNTLVSEGHLKDFSQDNPPVAGDFVEFKGSLKRNPIVETLDSLAAMLDIAEAFSESSAQPKRKGKQANESSDYNKIKKQMRMLSEALKAGSTTDLTATNLDSGYTAVITVETNFLNDPLMSDIVDGEFKVIGKVVKSVGDDFDSISLLRKTALSKMPDNILHQSFEALSLLGLNDGFDIPEMTWKIRGPAIQILPIAIYA